MIDRNLSQTSQMSFYLNSHVTVKSMVQLVDCQVKNGFQKLFWTEIIINNKM